MFFVDVMLCVWRNANPFFHFLVLVKYSEKNFKGFSTFFFLPIFWVREEMPWDVRCYVIKVLPVVSQESSMDWNWKRVYANVRIR